MAKSIKGTTGGSWTCACFRSSIFTAQVDSPRKNGSKVQLSRSQATGHAGPRSGHSPLLRRWVWSARTLLSVSPLYPLAWHEHRQSACRSVTCCHLQPARQCEGQGQQNKRCAGRHMCSTNTVHDARIGPSFYLVGRASSHQEDAPKALTTEFEGRNNEWAGREIYLLGECRKRCLLRQNVEDGHATSQPQHREDEAKLGWAKRGESSHTHTHTHTLCACL